MKRPLFFVLMAFAVAFATWGWGGRFGHAGPLAVETAPAPGYDAEARDYQIRFFEERARRDPYSTQDWSWLAQLLLQRARETGSSEDVLRAERAARRSLEVGLAHNAATYAILSLTLLEQHRFEEALQAAQALVQAEPENAAYRSLLAEIQLELGHYEAADVTFGSLEGARRNLDVAPRLARWEELSGRTVEARNLLYAAREQAAGRIDLPHEQVAWFHLRVGDFELRNGRPDRAEEALRSGLAVFPGDYRLLAAMARLEAARERWDRAIDYGEQAVAAVPDAASLVLLSDLYAASGDAAIAEQYARAVEVTLAGQTGAFHRAEGLFLLDRGRRVPEVRAQAEQELRTRRDVYGYDLLAWALHKEGRNEEAREAMAAALSRGTRDAMLFYHAGMIERALGERERARTYLERALEVNPRFHPIHARVARATLACLGRFRLPWGATCD